MKIKKNTIKYGIFIIIGLCFCILYTLIIEKAGIRDAEVYYYFYNYISEIGYINFLFEHFVEFGKIEPGIYFIFSLFPVNLKFNTFIFINYLLFLLLFLYLFKILNKYKNIDIKNTVYLIVLLFSWYPIYSNLLWVWRNFFAVLFLILSFYIIKRIFLFILYILALNFHLSSIMFLTLILFIKKNLKYIIRVNYKLFILIIVFIGLILGIICRLFLNNLKFLSSGDLNWNSLTGENIYTGGMISIYLFIITLPFLSIKSKIRDEHLKAYIFNIAILLIINSFSLVFFDNHFVLHRIFIFTSIMYILFFFMFNHYLYNKVKMIVYFIIFLGIIPTIRSMINYILF